MNSETKMIVEKYIGKIDEADMQKFKDKMFKLVFGKSKEEVRNNVRKLTDKQLKSLAKLDFSKSGGAQKIQGDEIEKEMKKRGFEMPFKKK